MTAYCDFSDMPTDTCAHCSSAAPDKLAAIRSLALELMGEHGLLEKGWRFSFDNTHRRVAVCKYAPKLINFSKKWQDMPLEKVRNTILHEVAHALVGPGHGHGLVWQRQAIAIGCDGKRCVSGTDDYAPKGAWVGTCPGCREQIDQTRAPLNVKACASCCRGRFNPQFVFQWTKNGAKAPMPARFQENMKFIESKYKTKLSV